MTTEKISFSCMDYIISMSDKTRRPVIVCHTLYNLECNKHFNKKYKYIGDFDDINDFINDL
jgi:hypothetical protein